MQSYFVIMSTHFIIFISLLVFNGVLSQENNEVKVTYNNDTWKYAPTWPIKDVIMPNEHVTFFYSNKQNFGRTIKFSEKAIAAFDKHTVFKLSFQYWQGLFSKIAMKPQIYLNIDSTSIVLTDRYGGNNYDGNWLRFEKYLSKDQLKGTYFTLYKNDDSIIALKNLKLEYQIKKAATSDIFKEPEKIVNPPTFDDAVLLDQCTFSTNPKCLPTGAITSDNGILLRITDYFISESSSNDQCFELQYSAKTKETKISINFSADKNKAEDEIWSFRAYVDINPTKFEFCLSDFLAVNSKSFKLIFRFNQSNIKPETVKDFNIKIKQTTKNDHGNFRKIHFLNSMDKTGFEKEWIINDNRLQADANSILFQENTGSLTGSHSRISSDWITRDDKLDYSEGQFKVIVENKNVFERVEVRPRICDWLSHCEDLVKTEKINDKNNKEMLVNFENQLSNFKPKLFKLVFEIEYYKPIYFETSTTEIKLWLKLVKFGDPCTNFCKNGDCTSDNTKSLDEQKPSCDCTNIGFTGDKCELEDYCKTKTVKFENAMHHANQYCRIKETPRDHEECYNVRGAKTFSCACDQTGQEYKFFDGSRCSPIEGKNDGGWEKDGTKFTLLKPSYTRNSITYGFKMINEQTKDICASISYSSNISAHLKIEYKGARSFDLVTDFILESGDHTFKYCLSDFYTKIDEDFAIVYRINLETSTTNFEFEIRELNHDKDYTKAIAMVNSLKSWEKPGSMENWKGFQQEIKPADKQVQMKDNGKIANENLIKWIASPWINFNKKSKNNMEIIVSSTKDSKYSMIVEFLFEENGRMMRKNQPEIEHKNEDEGGKTKSTHTYNIPNEVISPFKVLIKFNFNKGAENETFDVTLESVSLSDPGVIEPPKDLCDPTTRPMCDMSPLSFLNKIPYRCIKNKDKIDCVCEDGYYKWNPTAKRCLRTEEYGKAEISCGSGKCSLFDYIDSDFDWASEKMPQLTKEELVKYTPFIFSSNKNDKQTIQFENVDVSQNLCFVLNYHMTPKSSLEISYDDTKPFVLTNLEEDWNKQKICTSYLSDKITKLTKINFKSDSDDTISIHLEKPKLEKLLDKQTKNLDYITFDKLDKNDESFQNFENQWPFQLPKKQGGSDEWVSDGSDIKFQALYKEKRSSYLISNWIHKFIDGMKIRFQYKPEISNENKTFTFKVILLDNKNQKQYFDVIPDKKDLVEIEIPKMTSSFRVALNTNYSVTPDKLGAMLFKISDIDVGDFCLQKERTRNYCTNNQGTCHRDKTFKTSSGGHCDCESGYYGSDCHQTNWCETPHMLSNGESLNGNDYCSKNSNIYGECVLEDEAFKCDCRNNTNVYWNTAELECKQFSSCFSKTWNFETEKCHDDNGTAIIKCRDGYIDQSKDGKKLICKEYDECDPEQREKMSKLKNDNSISKEPCVGQKAKCSRFNSDGIKEKTCHCPPGYSYSEYTAEGCSPKFCDSPTTNLCEQECITKPNSTRGYECECSDLYTKDGEFKCKPKKTGECKCKNMNTAYCDSTPEDCKCMKGFEANDPKIEECKAIDKPSIDISLCPSQEFEKNKNGKLVCKCGPFFHLNENTLTCEMDDICSDGSAGSEKCAKRNAICRPTLDSSQNYSQCECPDSRKIKEDEVCLNHCDIRTYNELCLGVDAICDPTATPNSVPSSNVFSFCKCPPGYIQKSVDFKLKCVISAVSAEFSLTIRNNLDLSSTSKLYGINYLSERIKRSPHINNDPLNYAKQYQMYMDKKEKLDKAHKEELKNKEVEKLILMKMKKILPSDMKAESDSLDVKSCKKSADSSSYICSFTFQRSKEIKDYDLKVELNKNCQKLKDNPNDCLFPSNSYSTSNDFNMIVSQIDPTLSSVKTCMRNTCSKNPFSNCKEYEDTTLSLHRCNCDQDFQQIGINSNLNAWNGKELKSYPVLQNCALKPYCGVKCKVDTTQGFCFNSTQQLENGDWKAIYKCACNDKYRSNTTDSIEYCHDACHNYDCHHGTSKYDGNSCKCICEERWSGEFCDSEYSSSVGGWIAGIVILAVLVVIISGVAFMFARRSRTDNQDYSGNRNMNEFSGSSYRVPPGPQQRGHQNPSFHTE